MIFDKPLDSECEAKMRMACATGGVGVGGLVFGVFLVKFMAFYFPFITLHCHDYAFWAATGLFQFLWGIESL